MWPHVARVEFIARDTRDGNFVQLSASLCILDEALMHTTSHITRRNMTDRLPFGLPRPLVSMDRHAPPHPSPHSRLALRGRIAQGRATKEA